MGGVSTLLAVHARKTVQRTSTCQTVMTKTHAKAMTAMSAPLGHKKAASVHLAVKRALMLYVIDSKNLRFAGR